MERLFGAAFQSIRILILVVLPAALFACAAASPTAMDLANYVNQGVLRISELEQKSLERYASVTGPNFKSNEDLYDALKERVLPLYSRFVAELRKIRPETEEVKNLHRIYIGAATSMLDGFKMLMIALETKEFDMIPSVNERIERGRLENERWRRELVALSKKYSIRLQ